MLTLLPPERLHTVSLCERAVLLLKTRSQHITTKRLVIGDALGQQQAQLLLLPPFVGHPSFSPFFRPSGRQASRRPAPKLLAAAVFACPSSQSLYTPIIYPLELLLLLLVAR